MHYRFDVTEEVARLWCAKAPYEQLRAAGVCYKSHDVSGKYAPEYGDVLVEPDKFPMQKVRDNVAMLGKLPPKIWERAFPNVPLTIVD